MRTTRQAIRAVLFLRTEFIDRTVILLILASNRFRLELLKANRAVESWRNSDSLLKNYYT